MISYYPLWNLLNPVLYKTSTARNMDYVKCNFITIIIIIIVIVKHPTVVKFHTMSDSKLTTLECVYFFNF